MFGFSSISETAIGQLPEPFRHSNIFVTGVSTTLFLGDVLVWDIVVLSCKFTNVYKHNNRGFTNVYKRGTRDITNVYKHNHKCFTDMDRDNYRSISNMDRRYTIRYKSTIELFEEKQCQVHIQTTVV